MMNSISTTLFNISPPTNRRKAALRIHGIITLVFICAIVIEYFVLKITSFIIWDIPFALILLLNLALIAKSQISVRLLNNIILATGYLYLIKINLIWGGLVSPYLNSAILFVLCSAFFETLFVFILWTIAALLLPVLIILLSPYLGSSFSGSLSPAVLELSHVSAIQSLIILFAISLLYFAKGATRRYKKVYESKAIMAELIRILSYEIARPTEQIKKDAEFLNEGFEDKQFVHNSLDKIIQASQAIQAITSRVQELKSLGTIPEMFSCHYFDLNEACEKAMQLYIEKAEKKKITIELVTTEDHCPIYAARDILIFQVISNLLSNAIKFSYPHSKIILHTSGATLTIQDQGMGMPQEILDKVFYFNHQTNRLGTSGEKGTGFGMPLVRNLLEKMNASIHIESQDLENHPHHHGTKVVIQFQTKT